MELFLKASGEVGKIGKTAAASGGGNPMSFLDELLCFVKSQEQNRIHNRASRGTLEFSGKMKFADTYEGGYPVQGDLFPKVAVQVSQSKIYAFVCFFFLACRAGASFLWG